MIGEVLRLRVPFGDAEALGRDGIACWGGDFYAVRPLEALGVDRARGVLRLYANRASGRVLGSEMIAPRGEHLAHLLAWAIQRGETARAVLQLPFYHPVVEEMLQSALQDIVRQQGDHCPWPMGLQALSSQPGG